MSSTASRVAIVGPGAVGGTLAAWLSARGGHAVTVCARTPFSTLRIDTPDGLIETSPEILTDPDHATPVDWVLATTKTYDVAGAARWLGGLIGPDTRLAVLQNGVEHRARFAGLIDSDRIVPCIVDIPAERTAPGEIVQRRMGTILVPDDPAGRAFVALFAGVMRALVRECIEVGRTEGADMPASLPDTVVVGYRAADPDSLNSLHADRLAGRPMELDARNGVIVRLGAAHGIDAPVNRMMVALIAAAAR